MEWSDYEILDTASEEVERKGKTVWKRRVEKTVVSDRMLAAGLALGMMLVDSVKLDCLGEEQIDCACTTI